MKIIRLQIPGNFLEHVGFTDLFQHLEFIEILKELESVNATKPKSILFFLETIQQNKNKKVKDND